MQNTTWGRKESIVWPYQIPIYAYSAAFFSAVLTFFFVLPQRPCSGITCRFMSGLRRLARSAKLTGATTVCSS